MGYSEWVMGKKIPQVKFLGIGKMQIIPISYFPIIKDPDPIP